MEITILICIVTTVKFLVNQHMLIISQGVDFFNMPVWGVRLPLRGVVFRGGVLSCCGSVSHGVLNMYIRME